MNTTKGRLLDVYTEPGNSNLGIEILRHPDGAEVGFYMPKPVHTFAMWTGDGKPLLNASELDAYLELPLRIDVELDHDEGQFTARAIRLSRREYP